MSSPGDTPCQADIGIGKVRRRRVRPLAAYS